MINYLQVENLTKSYGDLVLFDNISFTIGEGQRIALIGRNGSGKTTLLNILAGKDTADSGTITPRLAAEAEDERAEAREIVAKAMARLSPKLREVLHLKDIEGYATHEIARMLGVEENQVRTILSRARRGLRETIEKMDYGTNDGRY